MRWSRRSRARSPALVWVLPCVAMVLVACSEPGPDTTDGPEPAVPSGSPQDADDGLLPEHVEGWNEPAFHDFDAMVDRRRIRAAVAFSHTSFFLDGTRQRGLDYEALQLFEKEVNAKRGQRNKPIDVMIIPLPRDRILAALETGLVDLALANLTITPERRKRVDFSIPVFTDVREVLVTGPATESVESVEDLSGREVAVRRSSSFYESLQSLNRRFEQQGLAPVQITLTSELLETEDLLDMVNADLYPMTVADSHLAQLWSRVLPAITVHTNVAVAEGREIAWAFRKGSPELREFVNEFIGSSHKKGTLLGNILFERYLRSTRWAGSALSREGMKRFRETVGEFREYGTQYKIDPVVLTALAYQESGLDQSVRSPAGAVGIMQILPSTAADPNVGIADIEVLENNIHAGTRYLAFLRKRYFSGGELDEKNRWIFTIAAYNAGPAKIARLRKEAPSWELDPDQWFDNVEMVAARRIGRETVQYVGNIFKYWVAYSRTLEKLEKKRRISSSLRGDGA